MGQRFILLAAICLLATGCGRPSNSDPIPKGAQQGNPKPSVPFGDATNPNSPFLCDTPPEQQRVDAQEVFEDSITMASTYTNVEKTDCDGKIIETSVEESGASRVLFTTPAPEIDRTSKVLGLKITNLRTCKTLTLDAAKKETRTSMDVYTTGPNGERLPIAPAPFLGKDLSVQFVGEFNFMQIGTVIPLLEGVNVMKVEYQDCASCESPNTLHTTALKITVKHEVDKAPRKTVRRSMCRTAN